MMTTRPGLHLNNPFGSWCLVIVIWCFNKSLCPGAKILTGQSIVSSRLTAVSFNLRPRKLKKELDKINQNKPLDIPSQST